MLFRKKSGDIAQNEKRMLEIIKKRSKATAKNSNTRQIAPGTKALMERTLQVAKKPKETDEECWPLGIGA